MLNIMLFINVLLNMCIVRTNEIYKSVRHAHSANGLKKKKISKSFEKTARSTQAKTEFGRSSVWANLTPS